MNKNFEKEYILASGSKDKTIILWDINTMESILIINNKDAIKNLVWNDVENSIILSSSDHYINIIDVR